MAAILVGGQRVLALFGNIGAATTFGFATLWSISFLTRVWRWWRLGRHLSLDLPVSRAAAYFAAGFAFTTSPGRIGEAFRRWLLARLHNVPVSASAPLLIADRLSDLLCIVVMSVVGIAILIEQRAFLLIAIAIAMVILVLGIRPTLLIAPSNMAYAAAGDASSPASAGRCVCCSVCLVRASSPRRRCRRSAGGFSRGCCWRGSLSTLGVNLSVVLAIFIVGAALLAAAIPFMPGGLGGVELAMVGLLTSFDVPLETSLAATIVFRAMTY